MSPWQQWYTLNDVKSGRVHLVLEWLPRVSDLKRLEQVRFFLVKVSIIYSCIIIQTTSASETVKCILKKTFLIVSFIISCSLQILQYQVQQSYQNKVVPSAAMLFVYVERAHGLPVRRSAASLSIAQR